MDGDPSQPPPPPDSRQAPSVSPTVQMALYQPRGQPPGRQEEEEQLRSEDAPPPDDHDRLAEGALGGSDSTVSMATRARRRRRRVRPSGSGARISLERTTVGVSGSSNLAQNLPGTDAYWRSTFNEFEASTMHQSHVSLSYAGPRNVHSFGDIYQLPSVQNDVEDALSADNRLAEGVRGGSESTVSTATHPRRRRRRRRRVRPPGARVALERTVGVSGSSNLALMFAESRGVIHFYSVLTSSHTILAQVNSPTETRGALTELVAPVPTSDYYAGLDGPNIIHTLGNFARLPLDEPDEPVPTVTADEHNNTIHASSVRLPQQSLRLGDRVTLLPNF